MAGKMASDMDADDMGGKASSSDFGARMAALRAKRGKGRKGGKRGKRGGKRY